MSAFLRRIDLTTNILAPIMSGQIITYGSLLVGALVLALWNVVFLFVEFGFLYAVYKTVPELAFKKGVGKLITFITVTHLCSVDILSGFQ